MDRFPKCHQDKETNHDITKSMECLLHVPPGDLPHGYYRGFSNFLGQSTIKTVQGFLALKPVLLCLVFFRNDRSARFPPAHVHSLPTVGTLFPPSARLHVYRANPLSLSCNVTCDSISDSSLCFWKVIHKYCISLVF